MFENQTWMLTKLGRKWLQNYLKQCSLFKRKLQDKQTATKWLEALKVIENNWTGSLDYMNTLTDGASFTQRKQTYINFTAWILLRVSVIRFYLA